MAAMVLHSGSVARTSSNAATSRTPGPAVSISAGIRRVFFGIVLYTAAFIAEIVRAGILAVPKGQTEAAQAIGCAA